MLFPNVCRITPLKKVARALEIQPLIIHRAAMVVCGVMSLRARVLCHPATAKWCAK